jgi:hypothetical protein
VALVDFLPMIGGALAGIPTVLFAFIAGGLTAGILTAVVFAVYTQIENHVLNPVVMSKTVRINPLLVFIAVLAGASIGSLIGGIPGGFVAALLAIPTAGALQVLVKEVWQATAPDQPQETPVPAAELEESVVQQGELSMSPSICGSMTVERPGALSRKGASRASMTPVPRYRTAVFDFRLLTGAAYRNRTDDLRITRGLLPRS